MLEWGDNWDGEGSPGYTQSTLARAQDFLVANSIRLWQACRAVVDAPRVLPGPDGSIDLHWQIGDRELLLNVPADQDAPATYFGDSPMGEVVKGSLCLPNSLSSCDSSIQPWAVAKLSCASSSICIIRWSSAELTTNPRVRKAATR